MLSHLARGPRHDLNGPYPQSFPRRHFGSRGGYRSYPREMIAGIRKNGQLDWPRFLVVEEGNDVTSPLSSRRLDSTRRPTVLA